MTNTHPNSKIVEIHRVDNSTNRLDYKAQIAMGDTMSLIGSYMEGRNIGTGLEKWEVDELLPLVINTKTTDIEYNKKLINFYSELRHRVEPTNKNKLGKVIGGGLKLEIGKRIDNSKPIIYTEEKEVTKTIKVKNSEGNIVDQEVVELVKEQIKNYPINLEDYLNYYHIKGHPKVGENKQITVSNPTFTWYIYDKADELNIKLDKERIEEQAIKLYLNTSKKEDTVKRVCELISSLGIALNSMSPSELMLEYKKLAVDKPEDFIRAVNDKHLEYKFIIKQCLSYSILEKINNTIVDFETKDIIGNDLNEAVVYLQNKANSNYLKRLKVKLDDAIK